ncbi:MAG: hypothetical protein PHV38_01945 [Eubacteriales bacterium]|nr:hypothetical protein [Eubacteriales bacterium]
MPGKKNAEGNRIKIVLKKIHNYFFQLCGHNAPARSIYYEGHIANQTRKEIILDLIKEIGVALEAWDSIPMSMRRGNPTKRFKVFCDSLKKLEEIPANESYVKFEADYDDNRGTIIITIDGYVSFLKNEITTLINVMSEVDAFSICCLTNDKIEIALCFNDVFESKLRNNSSK